MITDEDPPAAIGPYRRLSRLGEGGMGIVYRAIDPAGREVAIKMIRSEISAEPTARRRLAREIDTMRRIRSPHVAEILDGDAIGEHPYVVTRFVRGRQLDDVVAEEGALAGNALHRLALGLARAVAAIHEAGVVHRDLKPGNTLLVDGEPVVIDFGIAQVSGSSRLTQTGMVAGTLAYIAPEMFDNRQASPASDVHAWAATVAFAATGREPFGAGTAKEVILNVMKGRADLDGVPDPLLPLLRAALDQDPTRRPTAAALARTLATGAPLAAGGHTLPEAPAAHGPIDPQERTLPDTPATHDLIDPQERTLPEAPAAPAEHVPSGRHPGGTAPMRSATAPPNGLPPHRRRPRSGGGKRWLLVAAGALAAAILITGGFALQGYVGRGVTTVHSLAPSEAPVEQPVPVASPTASATTGRSIRHGRPRHTPSLEPGTTPTSRRPRPHPPKRTSSPSSSPTSPRIVTPGAFCSPEGATGVTSAGTPMRCTLKTGETQPRWRSAG